MNTTMTQGNGRRTACLNCRGAGRISAKGYNCKTVCPACLGVGKTATSTPNRPAAQEEPSQPTDQTLPEPTHTYIPLQPPT
jgi:hypothetical protein